MTTSDPEDAPTQHHGMPPAGGPSPDDPTMPSVTPPEDATMPSKKVPIPRAPARAADALLGQSLGGCRIEKLLGRGAMGAVYKARQLKLDRDVAVKIIRAEMMVDPRMLKRFEVEARTVGKFNSANVVMVHDVGFENGVHYLVMEFVSGKNLREHSKLLSGGRLPAGEALPLLRQACKGLDDARRLGIIHRDIKPDNLMITDQGVLKIADFGIAKPVHEDFNMTLTSELIGTPLYMSPEQCQGGADLDFRSDMYSLGATFYYLLTGEPPVRASSVYELIQTKTKLENLCLWKALPELDENHPLSRVIERMTALDREDRYDSYEALLNDLVLVEQGGTIHMPKRDPNAPKKRIAARKGGANKKKVWIAAAVLLAAGGGGFAWSLSQGPKDPLVITPGPGDDGNHANSAADAAAAKAREQRVEKDLESLRTRLRDDGPSDNLQADVKKVQPPAVLARETQSLLADVEAGLAIKQRLGAIKKPTALVLPFQDLVDHLAQVTKAVVLDANAGGELRAWRDKAAKVAEAREELGPKALSALTGAFAAWQTQRQQAGDDVARKVELGTSLDQITEARRRLLDNLPDLRADIEQNLPQKSIDDARLGLSATSAGPDVVDAGSRLKQIREEFAKVGPSDSLRDRIEKLVPTIPEQLKERNQLLDDIQAANRVATTAAAVGVDLPRSPKPPFADVDGFYGRLDKAFDPVRDPAGKLPSWAEQQRSKLRSEKELQPAAVEAYRAMCQAWLQQRSNGVAMDMLMRGLDDIKAAREVGVRLFPSAGEQFEQVMPGSVMDEAKKEIDRKVARGQFVGDVAAMAKRLDELSGLASWRQQANKLDQDLSALTTRGKVFAGDGEVDAGLGGLRTTLDGWRAAEQHFGEAVALAAAGELTQAIGKAVPGGREGASELDALSKACTACLDAFRGLDTDLDLAKAQQRLGEAGNRVQSLSGLASAFDARLREWTRKLNDVKQASAGMVVIPGGSTVQPRATVPAFFLSTTECSHEEFAQFLAELKQATAGINDRKQCFDAVAARLAGAEMTPDRLHDLLLSEPIKDRLPQERVSYYVATACAAWQGRALPTAAEWVLAAFGDGKKYEYPWGNQWPAVDPQLRNTSDSKSAAVDEGGLSWRQVDGVKIHHLGGNVAEWLAADPASRSADVAGGSYRLRSDTQVKEQAGGRLVTYGKDEVLAGNGFRTVLRPHTVFGADWPR